MQVHYDEGVAYHIDPESCAGGREGVCEALDRGVHRPAIEPRKPYNWVPTPFRQRKAARAGALCEFPLDVAPRAPPARRVVADPGMCIRSLFHGNREISRSARRAAAHTGPCGEGDEPKPMMHDREKSDPAMGARTPANKAVSTVAEQEEQRAGTKGNAVGQSMHRVQDRDRVSQALDRVRQAAKERKTETFTSLLHHIGVELLRQSFLAIKRDAARRASCCARGA